MTYDKKEENEMCLSSAFKEACQKIYRNCNTAKGEFLPKPVRDEYVATIEVRNGNCSFVDNFVYLSRKTTFGKRN